MSSKLSKTRAVYNKQPNKEIRLLNKNICYMLCLRSEKILDNNYNKDNSKTYSSFGKIN